MLLDILRLLPRTPENHLLICLGRLVSKVRRRFGFLLHDRTVVTREESRTTTGSACSSSFFQPSQEAFHWERPVRVLPDMGEAWWLLLLKCSPTTCLKTNPCSSTCTLLMGVTMFVHLSIRFSEGSSSWLQICADLLRCLVHNLSFTSHLLSPFSYHLRRQATWNFCNQQTVPSSTCSWNFYVWTFSPSAFL